MLRRWYQKVSQVAVQATGAAKDLPAVVRDRQALRHWLLRAHKAQVMLAIVVIVGWLLMPPIRDAVLQGIFPNRTTSRFFGLSKRTRRHPSFKVAQAWSTTLYWGGTLGWVALAFWLRLPAARRWAEQRQHGRPRTGENADNYADNYNEEISCAQTMAHTPPTRRATGPATEHPAGSGPQPGALVASRYQLVKELGRGGMGIVYQAHDPVLGRDVALKSLPRALSQMAELGSRFQLEARALAQLMHPHIVQVFDLLSEGADRWIVMELVDGGSLAQLIRQGPSPLPQVLRLCQQMADALAYSHQQGVIHRDLKPANVLLTQGGDVKVTDFGLAKLMNTDSALTQAGALMGSPDYMSPEQAAGKATGPASDIYSFGIALYELATGRLPFAGDLAQILAQHLTQPPPPPRQLKSDIPEPLETMILQMLAKQPEGRPQSMSQVLDRLTALSQLVPQQSPSPPTS